MKRRDFLRTAGGSAATVGAASGAVAGQESTDTATPTDAGTGTANGTSTGTGTGTATGTSGGGGGPTKEVLVGPGGNFVFEPAELEIKPGTTVKFVWKSDNHNIVVGSQPEGANWKGTPGGAAKLYNTGYTYEHTFTVEGKYHYWCQPHKSAGMIGDIIVSKDAGGGGGGKRELHSFGVPIQAHWVGAGTMLMVLVSLIFTFYVLKYGESPNTGNTGGGEN